MGETIVQGPRAAYAMVLGSRGARRLLVSMGEEPPKAVMVGERECLPDGTQSQLDAG